MRRPGRHVYRIVWQIGFSSKNAQENLEVGGFGRAGDRVRKRGEQRERAGGGREAGGRRTAALGEEVPSGSSEPSPTSATFPALLSCGWAFSEGPAPAGDQTEDPGGLGAPVANLSWAGVQAGGWTEARLPGPWFHGPKAAGGLSSAHCPQRDGHSPRPPPTALLALE